jgi:hypothetical protein
MPNMEQSLERQILAVAISGGTDGSIMVNILSTELIHRATHPNSSAMYGQLQFKRIFHAKYQ